MVSCIITMVSRGDSSVWIQKIYQYFKHKPFTCKDITDRLPEFNKATLTAMRNSNVIRLLNRKKRAVGLSTKKPSVWVFTTEALFVLQRYE